MMQKFNRLSKTVEEKFKTSETDTGKKFAQVNKDLYANEE